MLGNIWRQPSEPRVGSIIGRLGIFNPGDQVLVLVPTVGSKFLARCQGPYKVFEKM